MSDFIEENVRTEMIDLSDLPDSLTYKLVDADFTYGPERFGINIHHSIEYYEALFEKKHPGLLKQFPMLYYLVEEWYENGISKSPLEHLNDNPPLSGK